MAATYAHATAPLRRLADRYVVEAALSIANGRAGRPTTSRRRSPSCRRRWPRPSAGASGVDAAVLDLAEAVAARRPRGRGLRRRRASTRTDRGAVIQLVDPAVLARVQAHRVDPGDEVRVQLHGVDLAARRVELHRVG